ncbi:phospholipase effector Tle1 domain-containing protein [Pantoea sp. SGAir0175]
MRHLFVCLDGTGNSPGQTDIEYIVRNKSPLSSVESNVLKIWCALTGNKEKYKPTDLIDSEEYKYYGLISSLKIGDEYLGEALYINGVGSQGDQEKMKYEGATGSGTNARILDAYRFLAERYTSGDKIYLFGFSRGAFSARSLASFIRHLGMPLARRIIPEKELPALWASYRNNLPYSGGLSSSLTGNDSVEIEFLGLWDTVGSLVFQDTFNKFHQISPKGIKHVRHALALDEVRPHFSPMYWNNLNEYEQIVKEVWFCGVHSNIGGGYQVRGCQISPIYGCSVSLPKPQGFQGAWKKLQNTLPRLLSQHMKCVTPIQNFTVALKLFLLP